MLDFSVISADLMAKGIYLLNEWAWRPDDALEVIDQFERSGQVVTGLELWREVDGHPMWIATSNYEGFLGRETRNAQNCAEGAPTIHSKISRCRRRDLQLLGQ